MTARTLTLILCLISVVFVSQNCSKELSGYEKADGKRGGIYYDTFWASEGGFLEDTSAKINKFKEFANFFKCNHCHGWDFKGNKGAYIGLVGNSTRPNVSSINLLALVKSKTSEELFHLIKTGANPALRRPFTVDLKTYHPIANNKLGDQMPNYQELLTDQQIWDIVKYLKFDMIDGGELYSSVVSGTYPTGKVTFFDIGKGGVTTKGRQLYDTKSCGIPSCHGLKGNAFLIEDAYTVGAFVRKKPYVAYHKIKYGKLGTPMTAKTMTVNELKDLYRVLSDSLLFPSTQ